MLNKIVIRASHELASHDNKKTNQLKIERQKEQQQHDYYSLIIFLYSLKYIII